MSHSKMIDLIDKRTSTKFEKELQTLAKLREKLIFKKTEIDYEIKKVDNLTSKLNLLWRNNNKMNFSKIGENTKRILSIIKEFGPIKARDIIIKMGSEPNTRNHCLSVVICELKRKKEICATGTHGSYLYSIAEEKKDESQ